MIKTDKTIAEKLFELYKDSIINDNNIPDEYKTGKKFITDSLFENCVERVTTFNEFGNATTRCIKNVGNRYIAVEVWEFDWTIINVYLVKPVQKIYYEKLAE